MHEKLTKRYIA